MADTVEVPSLDNVKDEGGSAFSGMIEGAMASTGVELGGAAIPVLGEALGGFALSLFAGRTSGKQYINREAGRAAMERLLR